MRCTCNIIFIVTALSNFGSMTALAADDGPDHGKYLTDNGDGTYTLELTVTGDADTEVETAANVNVVVVYDTSSSMTRYRANGGNSGPRRADAAEFVIHEFAENLFEYQSTTDPTNIQLAIVAFDHSARTVVDWNNSSNENYILNRLSATGAYNSARITGGYSNGTNWEDAMKAAENLLNSSQTDDDPTFVIFFTDGMPSQRTGTPVFSNIYVPAGPPTGDSSHGALFGVIALAAAAVCAGAFAVSRRRAR